MAPAAGREKCGLADRRAVSNGLREAWEEHVFGLFWMMILDASGTEPSFHSWIAYGW